MGQESSKGRRKKQHNDRRGRGGKRLTIEKWRIRLLLGGQKGEIR